MSQHPIIIDFQFTHLMSESMETVDMIKLEPLVANQERRKSITIACRRCLEFYFFDFHFMENVRRVFQRVLSEIEDNGKLFIDFFKNRSKELALSNTSKIWKSYFSNDSYELIMKEIDIKRLEAKENGQFEIEITMETFQHEYRVGFHSINYLRSIIPNFYFIYGIYQPKTPSVKLLVEYVKGVTFYAYLKEIIGKEMDDLLIWEFLSLMIQIMLSLHIAQEHLLFTHYDLHCNNIMIKTLAKPQDIHYPTILGTYIVKQVSKLPVIIDYGHVSVQDYHQVNRRLCLEKNMSQYGKHRSYSPSYDVHEFLLSIYIGINNNRFSESTMGYYIVQFIEKLIQSYYNIQFTNPSEYGYVKIEYYKQNHGNFHPTFVHDYLFRPSIYIVKAMEWMSTQNESLHKLETKQREEIVYMKDKSLLEFKPFIYELNTLVSNHHLSLFEMNFKTKYVSVIPELKRIRDYSMMDIINQLRPFLQKKQIIVKWLEGINQIPHLYHLEVGNQSNLEKYINYELKTKENKWNWKEMISFYEWIFLFVRLNKYNDYPFTINKKKIYQNIVHTLVQSKWSHISSSQERQRKIQSQVSIQQPSIDQEYKMVLQKTFEQIFQSSESLTRLEEIISFLDSYEEIMLFLHYHINDIVCHYHKYFSIRTTLLGWIS